MSYVDTVNNSPSLGGAGGSLPGKSLGQEDFLRLMIEQFRAQDPTKPMDNSQFVAQMAQFSQITAVQEMQKSFDYLSQALQGDQVLRAANLIGRQVLVPADQFIVNGADNGDADGASAPSLLNGAVNVPGPLDKLRVEIRDGTGAVIRTIELGAQEGGLTRFTWDGRDAEGNPIPPGKYHFTATSGSQSLQTYSSGLVSGIGSTGSATYLQVEGFGGVLLNQVAQII